MTINELLEKIGDKELNYQLIESAIATMYKDYNIDNTVLAYRLLYAFILSYGFFSGDEAIEVVESLVTNNSAFELSELAKQVVPTNAIEYYEKLLEMEHITSLNVITSSLFDSMEEVEDLLEEAGKAVAEFEEKFRN